VFTDEFLHFNFQVLNSIFSEVEAVDQWVKKNTETTISCKITGIAATATVEYLDSLGKAITGLNYSPDPGAESSGTQEPKLLVKAAAVLEDTAYICRVTSKTYPDSAHSDTKVYLYAYGMSQVYIFYDMAWVHLSTQCSYITIFVVQNIYKSYCRIRILIFSRTTHFDEGKNISKE
jgi:hypothetical protein